MSILNKSVIYTILFLFIIISVPAHVSAENLIQNGSFEDGQNKWTTTTTNIATLEAAFVPDIQYEGSQSARLKVTTTTSSHGIKQKIDTVTGGQQYKINGYIKTLTAPTETYIRIAWYEEDSSLQLQPTTDSSKISSITDWTPLTISIPSPESAVSAEIRLYVKNGTAYFDDITMEEYTELISTPTATITPSPTSTRTPTPTPTPTLSQTSYNNIYISEAMVAPNTGEKEWVELYNDNDFKVTLSDWFIDDISEGGSSPKKISITLESKKYSVIELTTSIFNNSGDVVRLLDQNENEKDFFEYSSSEKGKSWGWTSVRGNEFCLQSPSKNNPNTNCISSQSSSEESSENSASRSTNTNPIKKTATQILGTSTTAYASYTSYAILVTPPTLPQDKIIISEDINNENMIIPPQSERNPYRVFPFLAATYSLLSIGSLAVKMIYS